MLDLTKGSTIPVKAKSELGNFQRITEEKLLYKTSLLGRHVKSSYHRRGFSTDVFKCHRTSVSITERLGPPLFTLAFAVVYNRTDYSYNLLN